MAVQEDENHGFDILAPPQWTAPMVFNSPHSGSYLPPGFRDMSCLPEAMLHMPEDSHVDDLFQGCLAAGAPMLRALISRTYLDLNREPYEFDARMFHERLPAYMNSASPRVASGLGTIPRTVGDGIAIYNSPLCLVEALGRVESLYRPYHRTLAALLAEAHRATGTVLLVDCHSMPSSAVQHMRTPANRPVDVVIGDRFGNASGIHLVEAVIRYFEGHGLTVSCNKPYAGGFITETHGRPREGRHAVQIEVNRALYMNERTRERSVGFTALKNVMDGLALVLAALLPSENQTLLAAE